MEKCIWSIMCMEKVEWSHQKTFSLWMRVWVEILQCDQQLTFLYMAFRDMNYNSFIQVLIIHSFFRKRCKCYGPSWGLHESTAANNNMNNIYAALYHMQIHRRARGVSVPKGCPPEWAKVPLDFEQEPLPAPSPLHHDSAWHSKK